MDRTLTENDVMVIKSLNADLRAISASLAAAENRVTALEAENERLTKALSIIGNAMNLTSHATEMGIDCSQHTNPATTMCAIAREALQAKEAE